jgi:hypothetical protein
VEFARLVQRRIDTIEAAMAHLLAQTRIAAA